MKRSAPASVCCCCVWRTNPGWDLPSSMQGIMSPFVFVIPLGRVGDWDKGNCITSLMLAHR